MIPGRHGIKRCDDPDSGRVGHAAPGIRAIGPRAQKIGEKIGSNVKLYLVLRLTGLHDIAVSDSRFRVQVSETGRSQVETRPLREENSVASHIFPCHP